jgi:DNA-binding transcriptional MerR regulator
MRAGDAFSGQSGDLGDDDSRWLVGEMKYYRLNELTDATGVTPRTIRFYIAEGLLPPPQGAGPAAVYTPGHRDRLRLIGILKDQYLPLREIRRRLATMTDAQVRAELQALEQEQVQEEVAMPAAPASAPPTVIADAPSNSAADYLDRVLDRKAHRLPPPVAPPAYFPPAQKPATPAPAPAPTRQQWERIALADGIELHVREDRRQERILLEALIRQARKLLGEP